MHRRPPMTDINLDDLDLMEGPLSAPDTAFVGVRCSPALTIAIDDWIGRQPARPFLTRPEAFRRLAVMGLRAEKKAAA
jgi:hypothetical protein